MTKPRRALDAGSQLCRGRKRVNVATSSRKPAVDLIGERGCIWNRDKQCTVDAEHTADLIQRGIQFLEVLKAMVRDNCRESAVRKRKFRGIALNESGYG
jgi:hypothetical protein